jgi:hypothetical protein
MEGIEVICGDCNDKLKKRIGRRKPSGRGDDEQAKTRKYSINVVIINKKC